ncbi:hypothetical protein [Halorubrum ezzemoulense]|nr:hypothetical protein [Halorubrum ezzemoulense]
MIPLTLFDRLQTSIEEFLLALLVVIILAAIVGVVLRIRGG